VDASLHLFREAAAEDADAVVVHHGISWGGGLKRLTGIDAVRLQALFSSGISLYACHLPLDWHPEVGNNAVIAARLELVDVTSFSSYGGLEIGRQGRLPEPVSLDALRDMVDTRLATQSQALAFGPATVGTVGIVSGGGADALADCAAAGLDCLITGEVHHQHIHPAQEMGVNMIVAGHYRTEVTGVQAVMERVQAELELDCQFIDLPTGF
jgi:dinuclear metal center YbgI/SA1388 family protein